MSGVLQDSVFASLLFLLYTSKIFSILEDNLISYANDSTLMAVVPSPSVRITVAVSLKGIVDSINKVFYYSFIDKNVLNKK